MKLTKILLSTLCAVALALAFSACSSTTTINVNTAANNANKSNKNVVSNSPAASATTAPNAVKPTPETTSKVSDAEIKIKGELQKGDAESLILYFGEESGDYAAYCFSNNSDAGRKILAACKDREQCEVTGETEAGSCKVPGLEADLSDSGRIVKASAAKSLGGKK